MKKILSLMISAVFVLGLMVLPSLAAEENAAQNPVEYKFGPIPKSHVKLLSWYIDKYMDDVIAYEIEKKAPVKHVSQRSDLFSSIPHYGWASIVKIKTHDYRRKVIGHHLRKDSKGRTYREEIESYPIKSGFKIKTYRFYVRNYSIVAKELLD